MAATTGFRTLYPAIIPIGAMHVHAINSCIAADNRLTVIAGAFMSALTSDYFVRSSGNSHIFNDIIRGLPFRVAPDFEGILIERYLRLNCLNAAYAPLWEEIMGTKWTHETPLRNAEERHVAQADIDVHVASSLGVTVDELCLIYRTQFPVMRRYDREDHFDLNGRKLPKEVMALEKKLRTGEQLSMEQRKWIHPQSKENYIFEYPFRTLDREQTYRAITSGIL